MTPHLSPGDIAAIEAAVRNLEGDTRPFVDLYDRDESDDEPSPAVFWIVAIPLGLLVAGAVVAGVMIQC